MSEKYNTIFAELGSYDVKPPDGLTDKVLHAIAALNKDEQSGIVVPGDTGPGHIQEIEPVNIAELNILQNFELTPPAFDFNSIANKTKHLPASHSDKPVTKTTIPLKIWYRVAVAVFIAAIFTWTFYAISPSNKPSLTNNNSLAKVDENKVNDSGSSTNPEKKITHIDVQTLVLNRHRNAKSSIETIRVKNNMPVIMEDAQHINITDNDIFLTLVKFNYIESATFLTNIEKTKKIQLDQFSYVTISDKMAGLLAKMYATKRNKKPTRQAKKVRAKLEQWKKQDEKHFDNSNKDPLDIVDLSEFILN